MDWSITRLIILENSITRVLIYHRRGVNLYIVDSAILFSITRPDNLYFALYGMRNTCFFCKYLLFSLKIYDNNDTLAFLKNKSYERCRYLNLKIFLNKVIPLVVLKRDRLRAISTYLRSNNKLHNGWLLSRHSTARNLDSYVPPIRGSSTSRRSSLSRITIQRVSPFSIPFHGSADAQLQRDFYGQ